MAEPAMNRDARTRVRVERDAKEECATNTAAQQAQSKVHSVIFGD